MWWSRASRRGPGGVLILAGLLAAGAIQGLSLAQILYLLPIGVFAMSVAAADLPELSREHQRPVLLAARMRAGQERIAFFVVFCAVAFVAAGKPIVGAAFERGEFTADDTIFVWLVLAAADPVEERIAVVVDALRAHAGELLEGRYLPPAVRARLEG